MINQNTLIINHKYKRNMACSKYEYVKKFEEVRSILPQTYILVRIDVLFLLIREEDSRSFAQHMHLKNQTIFER